MTAVDLAPTRRAAPGAAPGAAPAPARAPRHFSLPAEPKVAENAARLGHTIDLRQNRTVLLLTGLFVTVVCVLFASLWLGQFSKTETARGLVSATGGVSRLDAPKSGVISQVYVKQGDKIEAGKPVYMLQFGEAGTGGETAVAGSIRTSMQTRTNLENEIGRADAFIKQTKDQQSSVTRDQEALMGAIDSQEKSIQTALGQAREKVQRIRALVQQGYATRDVLDTSERSYFEYERQLTEVKLKRVEYKRQDADKRREVAAVLAEKETQKANAENQINAVDGQVGRLKTESALQVRAQTSGQVLSLAGKISDSVELGQFVAAIGNPDAEPLIVLEAPARAIGLVKVGQKVVLKYDAFPYKTFGIQQGTITSISSSAIRAPDSKGDSGLDPRPDQRQSLYRIEVKPDSNEIEAYGEKTKIKIGSTLSADIVVEKRRLIDWVLDPIRAMRGRA